MSVPTTLTAERLTVPGSAGDVLRLIRAGIAVSRAELVRITGLAPSTVSLRVDSLIGAGLIREQGPDAAGGGRARALEIAPDGGLVGGIDLGAHHARVALSDLAGTVVDTTELGDLDSLGDDPATITAALWSALHSSITAAGRDPAALRCIAIGIPAPVSSPSGRVKTPSFRPGWHDVDFPALFAGHTAAPLLVENDGNLIAVAERRSGEADADDLIAVTIGSRIGAGVIAGGRLHRGATGAAGEFSHSTVDGSPAIGCVCGVPACLESVASGRAIKARLSAAGREVDSTEQLVGLALQGDPEVVAALRESGAQIGRSLSGIVNFVNPRTVVIAGSLSAAPQLVAAIRSELYGRCLPLIADDLDVRTSDSAADAELRGAIRIALDDVFSPIRVEAAIRTPTSPGAGVR